MVSSTESETRRIPVYKPLHKLANDDGFAQALIIRINPDLEFFSYDCKDYLLKGQSTIAWGYKPTACNVYTVRHRDFFQKLGMTIVAAPKEVERINGSENAPVGYIKRSHTIAGEVHLYSPRAFAFLGFIYETPATIKFQKILGLRVPISLPTAFKYAGLTNG